MGKIWTNVKQLIRSHSRYAHASIVMVTHRMFYIHTSICKISAQTWMIFLVENKIFCLRMIYAYPIRYHSAFTWASWLLKSPATRLCVNCSFMRTTKKCIKSTMLQTLCEGKWLVDCPHQQPMRLKYFHVLPSSCFRLMGLLPDT